MTETIRIFIADDHAIVREGLRALLATEPSHEQVGQVVMMEHFAQTVGTH